MDYLAVVSGRIHPVEVKSGASGSLKSLHMFLDTYKNSGGGIVFSVRPYAELPDKNITFVPLYFAFSATGGVRLLIDPEYFAHYSRFLLKIFKSCLYNTIANNTYFFRIEGFVLSLRY